MGKATHTPLKSLIVDMLVIEFGPVGVFFVVYYLMNFFQAALFLALSTLASLLLSFAVNKRLPWFALISGFATMTIALSTYIFASPTLLIVKDSLYYSLFALVLGVSIARKRYIFKTFFGHVFNMTDNGWKLLQKRWIVFFIAVVVGNEIARRALTPDEWVLYKQIIVLLFVSFGFYQLKLIRMHRSPEASLNGFRV